jgi:hypothetical protein
MLRLFERREIHAEEYGRGSNKPSRIKLGSSDEQRQSERPTKGA